MSKTDCYYIEEIPVQEINNMNKLYVQENLEKKLTRKQSQDVRLHEIEHHLHMAENRCNTLKDQLDFMKMICHSSDEQINIGNHHHPPPPRRSTADGSSNLLSKSSNKFGTSPHLNAGLSNTSMTPHKEVLLPLKDDEMRTQPIRDMKNVHKVSVCRKSYVDNKFEMNTQIKKGSKPTQVVSDTYVQNVAPIYAGQIKIPATSSVQRKLYNKTPRSLRTCESRDTVRTTQNRKKLKNRVLERNKQVNKLRDIKTADSRKTVHKKKPKHASSRATIAHTPKYHRMKTHRLNNYPHRGATNSDLVELYHNNKAKSFTESNSENSLAVTRRGYRKVGTFISSRNSIKVPPPLTAHKYVSSHSQQQQQQQQQLLNQSNYGVNFIQQNIQAVQQPSQQQQPFIQRKALNNPNQIKLNLNGVEQKQYNQQMEQYYQQQWQQYYQHHQQQQQIDSSQQNVFYRNGEVHQLTTSTNVHNNDLNESNVQIGGGGGGGLAPIDENYAYCDCQQMNASVPTMTRTYTCYQGHHYQMPTIASRLKQVTRSYLQQFNIKSIPFVTARSTTPSHNLGLNIQQVLSIMKTHQPISGISPTLAHNMGLVAHSNGSFVRGTENAINSLLLRMGSRQNCENNQHRSVCPLLKQATTVAETELADVPEHPCENEDDDTTMISPHIGATLPVVQTTNTNANANDADFNKRMTSEWDQATPAHKQTKCTCYPRKGVACNRLFNQYMNPQDNNTVVQQPYINSSPIIGAPPSLTRSSARPKQYKSAFSMRSVAADPNQHLHVIPPAENQPMPPPTKIVDDNANKNFHTQLAGKVRGLRDVLSNLHDDFQKMNDRYDALSEQVRNNSVKDPDAVQQLTEMERDLNAKEEEITVVISLYKEVLALKEQVRNLKERTSVLSMSMYATTPSGTIQQKQPPYSAINNNNNNCEPTVTLRLTKLLRQIQHFQGLVKQRP